MDYATAQLVLELQLQDLQDFEQAQHATYEQSSDAMHAVSVYGEELRRAVTSLSDQQLCRTLGQAAGEDFELIYVADEPGVAPICAACRESVATLDNLAAPCGHIYCHPCLSDLFRASTTDRSLFPPRCCNQNFPLQSARDILDSELLRLFDERSLEFSLSNPTYCVQCSTLVPPEQIVDHIASCIACKTSTCSLCKWSEYKGFCTEDTANQVFIDFAEENSWQRCYSCRRMVELTVGCNHVKYVHLILTLAIRF